MYGKENVIGFEVHLDETEPHAHVNIVPVAMMKQRGNVGGYVKIDADGNEISVEREASSYYHVHTPKEEEKPEEEEKPDEDKPEEKPAACGAADKPEEKPAACGSACGAGDK